MRLLPAHYRLLPAEKNTNPVANLLYPECPTHTPPTRLVLPEGRMTLRDAHLTAPSKAANTQMAPADQRSYFRGLEMCLTEAHWWYIDTPCPQIRTGKATCPRKERSKKAKRGQMAQQCAR